MKQKLFAASVLIAALLLWKFPSAGQNARLATVRAQGGQPSGTVRATAGATSDECQRMANLIERLSYDQRQISVSMGKLTQSITNLQNDSSASAVRPKIAEQQAILNVMQIYLAQQDNAIQSMTDELKHACPESGDSDKPAPK
jgi:hypothetical protein